MKEFEIGNRRKAIFLWQNHLSQTQFIAYGFFCVILAGALLLTLPFASRDGQSIGFLNALFTATSATCVTGLVVADTWSQWTLFGQIVIICLIQIGGLGFITIGVCLSIILRRKIGLKERGLLQESVNTLQIGGVVRLARKIFIGTIIFEGTGAILLAIRFVPQYGFFRGVFYGFFHSISAFCNAGFSTLYGNLGNELVLHNHNLLYITISFLVILGGIGFPILVNLYETVSYESKRLYHRYVKKNKRTIRKIHLYNLNTRIVLIMTAILLVTGTVAIVVFEWNHAFEGMTATEKWVQGFFNATCPRTAGFSSVGMTTFSVQTLLLMVVLMMIGGGTQSTAGGVKVNVFAVVMLNLRAILIGADKVNIFNRELSHDSIRRSNATLILYLLIVFAGIFGLSILEPQASVMALVFECTSALSTVGSSLDLTPTLGSDSKLIVIVLMFIGRVGVLTLISSLIKQKKITKYKYPSDNIIIN